MKESKIDNTALIYNCQCIDCAKEGTYNCKLDIVADKCVNFLLATCENCNCSGGY